MSRLGNCSLELWGWVESQAGRGIRLGRGAGSVGPRRLCRIGRLECECVRVRVREGGEKRGKVVDVIDADAIAGGKVFGGCAQSRPQRPMYIGEGRGFQDAATAVLQASLPAPPPLRNGQVRPPRRPHPVRARPPVPDPAPPLHDAGNLLGDAFREAARPTLALRRGLQDPLDGHAPPLADG